jgi:hypothetical protein
MWTSKKSILSQIRGDPTGITNDLKECLRREWLEKEFGVADSGQKYENRHTTNIRTIQEDNEGV